MAKKSSDALTPSQAADWLEAMPPVEVKNRLLDLLLWQAARKKSLVHISWYLRKMQEPKTKWSNSFQELTQRIGNGGGCDGEEGVERMDVTL